MPIRSFTVVTGQVRLHEDADQRLACLARICK